MILPALAALAVLSQADAGTYHAATPVTAPPPPPKAIAPPENPQPPPGEPVMPEADNRAWWQRWTPEGYIKAGIFYTFPFNPEQITGGNGGFRMLSARLGVQFNPTEELSIVTSLEAAAPFVSSVDPLTGSRIVELRDAYLEYRPFKFLWVRVGQFKAPFNGETLLGDGDLPFIARSIVTDGIFAPESNVAREGLTLGRQLGVQISSDRFGGDLVGFRYFLAAVNGNGQNQLFNDSNPIAPVLRLELDVMKSVAIGVNGYYNVRTDGIRPNRINTNQLGYGVDVSAHFGGLRALVGFLGRSNSYSASVLPPDGAFGTFAQVHYLFEQLGLEGAVRFAYYEPSTSQGDDQLIEINALVGYRLKKVPLRIVLEYTHREEASAVAIGNDSIDAMVQVNW